MQDRPLLELFAWTEEEFLNKTEGTAIRRIGYQSWLRNIAVALGNSDYCEDVVAALQNKRTTCTNMVREHIDWALDRQELKKSSTKDRLASKTEPI